MSPTLDDLYLAVDGFPRVSGDEPASRPRSTVTAMFSPRERG